MTKADILQETHCIERIIAVIRGEIPRKSKLITVNERHSDAFVLVLSGSCTYQFHDKTTFEATPGDVFYLPHRSAYTMRIGNEDYSFLFCDFSFVSEQERRAFLHASHGEKALEASFRRLLNTYRTASASRYAESMAILYGIYGTLQQSASVHHGKKCSAAANTKRYLEEHFAEPDLSISALAAEVGVSEVYLRRLFKACYHLSPIQYLTDLRMEHAKALMQYSFLPLEECAAQSGFSSLPYFCRVFKKETGVTPGIYRKTQLS